MLSLGTVGETDGSDYGTGEMLLFTVIATLLSPSLSPHIGVIDLCFTVGK